METKSKQDCEMESFHFDSETRFKKKFLTFSHPVRDSISPRLPRLAQNSRPRPASAQARTMTPPQPTDSAEAACAGRRTHRCPDAPGGPVHAVSRAHDAAEDGHAPPALRTSSFHIDDEFEGLRSGGGDLSAAAASCAQVHGARREAPQHEQPSFTELQAEADCVVPAGVSSTVTMRASSGPPLCASMRELRRLLEASETATSKPSAIANPKPVSRAREHQPRQAKSSVRVSSGNRFYAHVVATRQRVQAAGAGAQASRDEWLADVRSRQQHTPLQRARRAHKVQSDF